jgi:hypothetical protein
MNVNFKRAGKDESLGYMDVKEGESVQKVLARAIKRLGLQERDAMGAQCSYNLVVNGELLKGEVELITSLPEDTTVETPTVEITTPSYGAGPTQ